MAILTLHSYDADGLKDVAKFAQEVNPGTFVYLIRLDEDPGSDRTATFYGNVTEQVHKVCEDLAAHPILSTAPAINAMGFSQGGQFLRGYVERCNNPPVANLVTFGSQHMGISEFQACETNDWLCRGAQALLKANTWGSFSQGKLVPAQYYRNPEDMENYLSYSNFLADINNERKEKNQTYVDNMLKLEKFAMYLFEEDKTVIPKISGWFGTYDSTTGEEIGLHNSTLYKEDWIGLRAMEKLGKLDFVKAKGGHMRLTDKVLEDAFIKYFRRWNL
jgi:palmitoyl-protein thioesterase